MGNSTQEDDLSVTEAVSPAVSRLDGVKPLLLTDVAGSAWLASRPRPPGIARIFGEIIAPVVVAAVVSLAVQWLVSRWHVTMPSFAPEGFATVLSGVFVVAGFAISARSRLGTLGHLASCAGISALTTAVLSLMLVGTKFYLSGIEGDQLFRVEYVTRLTDSAGISDFAYADVPGYYPRGWFWLAGRFAALLHHPGWVAYKPFNIMTMAIGSVLAYVGWRLVIRPAHALLATLAVTTVAVATWAAVEPYAWVFGALIPPMSVIALRYLAADIRSPREDEGRAAHAVALGVLLGLLGLFYTLLFGFFLLVLVLTATVGLLLAWRARQRLRPVAVRVLVRLAIIGLVALPFLLVQWLPYLLAPSRTSAKQGALNFLPEAGTQFPMFQYPTSFAGVLGLVGLVWCVARLRDNVVARGLAIVVGAGYLWYALSMVVVLVNLTLLPFKVEVIMTEALRCAGVFGLLDAVGWLYRTVSPRWRQSALASVAVLALLGVVGELQAAPNRLSDVVTQAYRSYYPTSSTPLGQRDTAANGAWNQQLHDAIAELTGKPEHDLVVLSTYQDFLSFWPYWNFQTTKVQYANPLAQFDTRRNVIEAWAKSTSRAGLVDALRGSQFRAPNVFVFRRSSDGLHLEVSRDVFPQAGDNYSYDVVFPVSLFATSDFSRRDVGPFTVVTRH